MRISSRTAWQRLLGLLTSRGSSISGSSPAAIPFSTDPGEPSYARSGLHLMQLLALLNFCMSKQDQEQKSLADLSVRFLLFSTCHSNLILRRCITARREGMLPQHDTCLRHCLLATPVTSSFLSPLHSDLSLNQIYKEARICGD